MPSSHKNAAFDPSDKAEGVLDYILDESSEVTLEERANEIAVDDALYGEQIIKEESLRVKSRVLFITKDQNVFVEHSEMQKHFKNLAEVFDEVHVVVLGVASKKKTKTIRLGSKVWIYPSEARHFLQLPFAAYSLIKSQLFFTDGFRPDIVVALDPFESGITGYFVARHFKRAFQVHVAEDFLSEEYKNDDPYSKWRLRFAKYILGKGPSVRTNTDYLKQKVSIRYPNIKDFLLLPRYFDIQETIARTETTPKENKYPQFSFTVMYVGPLTTDSMLFRAIDAVRALLRSASIGFVVIGDGSARETFKERTKLLGIDAQVVFTPKVDDVLLHMRSADVLLCTDTTSESEAVVMKAAAAGLPLVIARTDLRADLFTDDQDAFLCDPSDTVDFSQKLRKFLNTNSLRTQFSDNAQETVRTRIEESPQVYRLAYRDSIEGVLYFDAQEEEKRKQALVEKEELKKKKVAVKEDKEKAKQESRKKAIKKSVEKANNNVSMNMPEQ
jgi:glycosyltransferase involved in cell wall biosynthesis